MVMVAKVNLRLVGRSWSIYILIKGRAVYLARRINGPYGYLKCFLLVNIYSRWNTEFNLEKFSSKRQAL